MTVIIKCKSNNTCGVNSTLLNVCSQALRLFTYEMSWHGQPVCAYSIYVAINVCSWLSKGAINGMVEEGVHFSLWVYSKR